MSYSLGRLDFGTGGLEHAHTCTVCIHLDTYTVSLASSGIEDSHVGLMDGHGLFHNTAVSALHRVRLDVLLHQVDAVHDNAGLILAQTHYAAFALVTTGQHDDFVAFANLVHSVFPLENFRSQRHDLHELFGTQFTCHGAKNTGTDGLQLGIQQHGSIGIELHQRAVCTTDSFGSTHHHRAVHVTFFDATTWSGFLNTHLDDVTNTGIASMRTAQHFNARSRLRAGVIGNL